jgi:hypothetical protein
MAMGLERAEVVREQARMADLLALAHPGAAWLEWLGPAADGPAPCAPGKSPD